MRYLFIIFLWSTLSFSQSGIDWGNLQWPASCVTSNCDFYAQVYKFGVTPNNTNEINAWIGYSATNTNPNTDNGSWTWVSAAFHGISGNNNEYKATLNPPPGEYYVASR